MYVRYPVMYVIPVAAMCSSRRIEKCPQSGWGCMGGGATDQCLEGNIHPVQLYIIWRTHARAVQSERRRLTCDHGTNELLSVVKCALTCFVVVMPSETTVRTHVIKRGDALFERQSCEPGGCVADRV